MSPNIAVVTGPIATGDTPRSPSSRSCSVCTSSTAKEAHEMPSATSPLRVKRVGFVMSAVCPVCPKQQTSPDPVGTSHLCQEQAFGSNVVEQAVRHGFIHLPKIPRDLPS